MIKVWQRRSHLLEHIYSAALGHIVPSVLAFWSTFWIVSLIGFSVVEGTGDSGAGPACGNR